MDPHRQNLICKNCGQNSIGRVKFPYPSKVRINPENHKVRLVVGPLHIFTFLLWTILFLIFSLSYVLGLDAPQSFILNAAVILITASLLTSVIFVVRRTKPAAVYQCANCNTIWLLKDKEDWEEAVTASGKFLKHFENPRRYVDDKNEKAWVCSSCGEKVPENYNVCWKCRTSRKAEA